MNHAVCKVCDPKIRASEKMFEDDFRATGRTIGIDLAGRDGMDCDADRLLHVRRARPYGAPAELPSDFRAVRHPHAGQAGSSLTFQDEGPGNGDADRRGVLTCLQSADWR